MREGAAFGEIREACVKLGLVDEASKEMKAALKEDEDSLDDSQLDAAERSMGMSADAVERLPDDAKRAVKALRGDPAFAGVRAAVEARRKRRAGGASKPKSKPKPAPPKPSPPKPTAGGNVVVVMDDGDVAAARRRLRWRGLRRRLRLRLRLRSAAGAPFPPRLDGRAHAREGRVAP